MTNQKKKRYPGIPVSPSYLPSYTKTMPRRVSGRSRSWLALLLRLRAKQADTALAFDTLPERCGSTISSTLAEQILCPKTVGGKNHRFQKLKSLLKMWRCAKMSGSTLVEPFRWSKRMHNVICNIKNTYFQLFPCTLTYMIQESLRVAAYFFRIVYIRFVYLPPFQEQQIKICWCKHHSPSQWSKTHLGAVVAS